MGYDVIIVGAGGMGCATAWHLGRQGLKVLLLDQFELANNKNASQDHSKAFRLEYGTNRFYAQLAADAYPLWKQLQEESGKKVFHQCGCLLFDTGEESYAASSYKTVQDMGHPIEWFDASEAAEKFPQFQCKGASFGSLGAMVEANTATLAMADLAMKSGVEIRGQAKVTDVQEESVTLEGGEKIYCDKVVVTAGSWVSELIEIPVQATRQLIVYFEPENPPEYGPEVFPVFGDLDGGFYGFPFQKGAVKVSNHEPGPVADPNEEFEVPDSFVEECRTFFREYIPGLADAKEVGRKVCHYSMTHNEDFIIDHFGPNVIVGAGFSGHGFKFTPLIGKLLAELVVNGKVDYDIERFRLANF